LKIIVWFNPDNLKKVLMFSFILEICVCKISINIFVSVDNSIIKRVYYTEVHILSQVYKYILIFT
jgi:hypothetical protein